MYVAVCSSPAVRFNRGKPFKPFEQLLAVLPAASASLLPEPFQWLMTDTRSPILDFYPEKFDIDMEGKRAEWEGVVKVPFIDEQRLLQAAASIPLTRWVHLLGVEVLQMLTAGCCCCFTQIIRFAVAEHTLHMCLFVCPLSCYCSNAWVVPAVAKL